MISQRKIASSMSDINEQRARWLSTWGVVYGKDLRRGELPILGVHTEGADAFIYKTLHSLLIKSKDSVAWKIPGVRNISIELIKDGGSAMICSQYVTNFPVWKMGLIVPVWKGKRIYQDYNSSSVSQAFSADSQSPLKAAETRPIWIHTR